jgi:hypothetical protein
MRRKSRQEALRRGSEALRCELELSNDMIGNARSVDCLERVMIERYIQEL